VPAKTIQPSYGAWVEKRKDGGALSVQAWLIKTGHPVSILEPHLLYLYL
jgi:hypothetical protein